MSDPARCTGAEVELSDLFRLAVPFVFQLDGVSAVSPADVRRAAVDRRTHRRTASSATASRPPGSGARRNERERNRVRQVNAGFDRLRDHVPQGRRNRKLSKVDTLRAAVEYIAHLQAILGGHPDDSLSPTSAIADVENYLDSAPATAESDVISSWYLNARCAPVDSASSLTQLLVSPADDFTRALQGGAGNGSSSVVVDGRLTVDVGHVTSSVRSSSTAASADHSTPESLDHDVTSSSDDAEQLLDFGLWFS